MDEMYPQTVEDTLAHSVLRCFVSGGVWHFMALVVYMIRG